MKLKASNSNPPLSSLIVLRAVKGKDASVEWGNETELLINSESKLTSDASICRYLAQLPGQKWYGSDTMQKCEVDHWLSFSSGPLAYNRVFDDCIMYLENCLAPVTYLVGKSCTIADIVVWSALFSKPEWNSLLSKGGIPDNLMRWYSLIGSLEFVSTTIESLPTTNKSDESGLESLRKEDAKFVELPGAKMGEVVVRFPPEASGYLHIGHAKAALLNQYYKEAFKGKLIMRFDDTNPAKEKVDFEKVILEDLELLQITPDVFTHTSDYFDLMLGMCETLIKQGHAYVDDTDPETMKKEREQRLESKNRSNSVATNLKMWQEMKEGSDSGQKCCVRAKINMASANGCMRDPTIYRCKNELHPKTGDKYKVYPTYDFACPIVDSIEDVTHCLRTMEYHDRDEQFYWFIDVLGLRKPYIWEYSRLNMTNTVLSKRKLTWFVENGYVDGWDDPRFPTVRGVIRRGMTVEGLKQFVIAQGSSRSVVVMEWDKIWAFNKKVIDPVAPRYTAVDSLSKVCVSIAGVTEEPIKAPKHPKNQAVGEKTLWLGPNIIIDGTDANEFKEGENVTFINWGNIKIVKINKDEGKISEIKAEPNLDNKDFKKTMKVTWLAETPKARLIPCICVYFQHIINKPVLGKDEDFKQYIDHCTKVEVPMLGDPELSTVKKSDIIQLQRKGFFICDRPYKPPSIYTGQESPIILFSIPDGHSKQVFPGDITQKPVEQKESKSNKECVNIENDISSVNDQIQSQGDVIRELKQKKVEKHVLDPEIKKLLKLKELYKSISGQDWKPNSQVKPTAIVKQPLQSTNVSINIENDISNVNDQIQIQGDVIRELKQQKAEKAVLEPEIKKLLKLKELYKSISGQDWKPNSQVKPTVKQPLQSTNVSINVENDISSVADQIQIQGNVIRELKQQKVEKAVLEPEIKKLLKLKELHKSISGQDWQPNSQLKPTVKQPLQSTDVSASDISLRITDVGNKIRKLKGDKADKNVIAEEVKILLDLKSSYKTITGQDWKPDLSLENKEVVEKKNLNNKPVNNSKTDKVESISKLTVQIKETGDLIRQLKSSGASKEKINESVQKLLSLKNEYKELSGVDFPTEGKKSNAKDESKSKEKKKEAKTPVKSEKNVVKEENQSAVKKVTRLGLEAKKEENLADWYSQIIVKGEMIEYYDVSGCYILRPWSYGIWEEIKNWLDTEIKKLGVRNCYFPMFVSKSVLEKEKTHIDDFAPEVAWVTKSGDSDLAEPIAVRPTSETVMYPAYAKWIKSHRDLPLKLNQWNNVVRWEFKHPQPFLRTREFLWQEGHTAFAQAAEAIDEVNTVLDLYAKVYTDLLAIPVIKGRKTEKEKFAGADFTLTVEAFISASGRAIQGATSHHLGQNFSKMFEIIYDDPDTQEKKLVYQNSWGMTTRTIGVLIMVHGDNQGLVLPPRVASIQVVIVPCGITASLAQSERDALLNACSIVQKKITDIGIRVHGDYRDNYSPGWKFNHWELKGVPIRMEIGPKDLKQQQVLTVRRDSGKKETFKIGEVDSKVKVLLDDIQAEMYQRVTEELNKHVVTCKEWNDFCKNLDSKNIILSPFCGEIPCEETIKKNSARAETEDLNAPSMGAKSLCIPLEQPKCGIVATDKCINPECSMKPKFYTLFGRSY